MQDVFQIQHKDNVATALAPLSPGMTVVRGDGAATTLHVLEEIPMGHKVAIREIQDGEDIVKYGVTIGRATQAIRCGQWVHLHCMRSLYDERSSHLDIHTGAPQDIQYE